MGSFKNYFTDFQKDITEVQEDLEDEISLTEIQKKTDNKKKQRCREREISKFRMR